MSRTTPTWFEINEIVKEFVPERLRIEATNQIWDKISHLMYRISDNDKLITELVNENTRLVKENLVLVRHNKDLTVAGQKVLDILGIQRALVNYLYGYESHN
jgi:hypothetical protein